MERFTLEKIAELLGDFDMVKITKNKVDLFGEVDNFRNKEGFLFDKIKDETFNDFDSEPDGIGNVWLTKQYKENGIKFSLNIRERSK